MAFNQIEDHIWRPRQHAVELRTRLRTQPVINLIRRQPQTRIDQPDIASRSAMADGFGLQNPHRQPTLRRMKRSRAARKSGPDDHQIAINIRE